MAKYHVDTHRYEDWDTEHDESFSPSGRRVRSNSAIEEQLVEQLEHVREKAQQFLEREVLFGVNEEKWAEREKLLRQALSPVAERDQRAAIFVTVQSSSIVSWGVVLALSTILFCIGCSLAWQCTEQQRRDWQLAEPHSMKALKFQADPHCIDLQGLVYPYISETARDMPQTGLFAFGMTISVMMMECCAILQYGKVKRDIRGGNAPIPVGAKRNFVALLTGLVAPPFLGLLACYDTRRALNTHRACVVIYFTLTIIYMFTTLSIYSYLGQIDGKKGFGSAANSPTKFNSRAEAHALDVAHHERSPKPDVHLSLRLKTYIASLFAVLTTFYLPVGFMYVGTGTIVVTAIGHLSFCVGAVTHTHIRFLFGHVMQAM